MRITIDGKLVRGSLFKVLDLKVSPDQTNEESNFLGETEADYDFQHNGFGLAWNTRVEDAASIDLLESLIQRDANQEAHPDIEIMIIYKFRDPSIPTKVIAYHDVFMKFGEEGFGGRKEYLVTSFEAKCKTRSNFNA